MKYLVTGVAGFIGFHVAKALIKRGDVVVGIDNMSDYYSVNLKRDRLKELDNQIKFYEGDISDFDLMDEIFKDNNFDKIIHLAAQAGVRYSLENPFEYEKSNGLGTLTIFELAKIHNVKNIVYASSSSVYGGNKTVPFSVKDDVSNQVSIYAAIKRYNELLAKTYYNLYGIKSVGLRFFTVYGSWGRPDMSYFKFMNKLKNGDKIQIYNNGDHLRDFTHISDIVIGILKASDKDNRCEIYNLGNNKPIKLMNFIKILEKIVNLEFDKEYLPMQPGDVHTTYADINLTKSELDWEPKIEIKEGLTEFYDWYKEYYK
jgi:UDP-glucuronate 4-epimerase